MPDEPTTSTPSPNVTAGWYPDPDRPQSQRYWDGETWTDQIAPLAVPKDAATDGVATRTWPKLTAYLGAAAIIVGTLGPWGTTVLESISGTSTGGKWCAFAGVVALILLAARRVVLFNVLIGIGVGLEGLNRISNVNSYSVHALGQTIHPASVGWGLYLLVVGCVALIVGSWFYTDDVKGQRRQEKTERESTQAQAARDVA